MSTESTQGADSVDFVMDKSDCGVGVSVVAGGDYVSKSSRDGVSNIARA